MSYLFAIRLWWHKHRDKFVRFFVRPVVVSGELVVSSLEVVRTLVISVMMLEVRIILDVEGEVTRTVDSSTVLGDVVAWVVGERVVGRSVVIIPRSENMKQREIMTCKKKYEISTFRNKIRLIILVLCGWLFNLCI